MKTIAFHTLGCKLNFAETSGIAREAAANGYEIVDFKSKADVYVIHSCLVTAAAERKTLAVVKQAAARNSFAAVAVLGCMSELNPERIARTGKVHYVLGNASKFRLSEFLKNDLAEEGQAEALHFEPAWSEHERTRSFVKIQDGCDYFCSYCTIPLARGRSRSATIQETAQTIQSLAAKGVREIVLTGVNIGDFGKHQGETLYGLLCEIESVDGMERVRLSSVEPDLLDDRIIELAASGGKLLPHFHIPLQSGSDRILKEMKRKYTTGLFAEKLQRIKERIPHCCVATDVIVGFPGESEKDFTDTLAFIGRSDLSCLHVFTYSERANTLAAATHNKIPAPAAKVRSDILLGVSEEKKNTFYISNAGRTARVFFESERKNGNIFGFTENYIRVRHPWSEELANRIVTVRLGNSVTDGTMPVQII